MSRREGTSNGMADNIFNSMELDAIGEVMNISLGSSATAVSNLLDHRVEITTPRVSVSEVKDFNISDLEPAIGVEIRYISGLVGSNIMISTPFKLLLFIVLNGWELLFSTLVQGFH